MGTSTIRDCRFERVIMGAVLLPVAAACAFSLIWAIAEKDPAMFLLMFMASIYLAAIYASVQAILYSFLMEFCVWRIVGVNPLAILVSSLLGLVCGLSVYLLFDEFLPTLLFSGFAAGLVTGAVLRCMKKHAGRPPAVARVAPGESSRDE